MSHSPQQPVRLTRRRALTGAAWSAPVIVVANAVPAFAVSPGSALDLQRGGSAAVFTTDGVDEYVDLEFSGLSVVVPTALSGGQLTLTVTYAANPPGGPSSMLVLGAPSGWSVTPTSGNTGTTVVMTYGPAIAAGTEVQVQSGIFVGAAQSTATQSGSYVLTAAAPGLTSDTEVFQLILDARNRKHPVPRPKV